MTSKSARSTVVPHGRLPVCSLDGATRSRAYANLYAKASALLVTVQEQNDTPTERRSGATHPRRRSRRTSRPNTRCARNPLQRGVSETSKRGRCVADTAASLMSMTASVGLLHFRTLRKATFMHRRPEELHCKKDPNAEFREEVQPVDDLRLKERKPTLRQHKHICHLATGSTHETRRQWRITCFGLTLEAGLQSSRMSAKITGRNRSLQIKLDCT